MLLILMLSLSFNEQASHPAPGPHLPAPPALPHPGACGIAGENAAMEPGRTQIKLDPRYTADLLEVL
ncbi:solute carrier family 51 subunit alpha, partial [Homo sapiens]